MTQSAERTRRRLAGFTGAGYDKGRSAAWQIAWFAVQHLIFVKWWLPARLRPPILRAFGATIGHGVLIRHGVRVHWPWKLAIGDDCWIGEDAWLLNLEPITIGSDVCVSQGAFLCTGSHNRRSPTFEFDNGAITIESGAWVAAQATVLRGSKVGAEAIIGAGATSASDVHPGSAVLANSTTVRLAK